MLPVSKYLLIDPYDLCRSLKDAVGCDVPIVMGTLIPKPIYPWSLGLNGLSWGWDCRWRYPRFGTFTLFLQSVRAEDATLTFGDWEPFGRKIRF